MSGGRAHLQLHRPRDVKLRFDAYGQHKLLVNTYLHHKHQQSNQTVNAPAEISLARREHRFVWRLEDDCQSEWSKRLAKKYYDRLFKEYAICDLSRVSGKPAASNKEVGMRWRTEAEVVSGRGQFSCAERRCNQHKRLTSWEVNFAYKEHGEDRNALVKIRLCPGCSMCLMASRVDAVKVEMKSSVDQADDESLDPSAELVYSNQEAFETIQTSSSRNIWAEPATASEEDRDRMMEEFLDEMLV